MQLSHYEERGRKILGITAVVVYPKKVVEKTHDLCYVEAERFRYTRVFTCILLGHDLPTGIHFLLMS